MNITEKINKIKETGLNIYDIVDDSLYLTAMELQECLSANLLNKCFNDLPLRTRSKRIKEMVAESLGYEIPKSFKRTKPAFEGQNFDVYSLKSNNLQIWNESICYNRRYVIIKLSENGIIVNLAVKEGKDILKLDTTGIQTHKYQAKLINQADKLFFSKCDTQNILALALNTSASVMDCLVQDNPKSSHLIPINLLFQTLKSLIGKKFRDIGKDQERVRGGYLQKLVCDILGYKAYKEHGQFPDLLNQLLEVKFQTSPTVDLGKVFPSERNKLDSVNVDGHPIEYCDIRYAVYFGEYSGSDIIITGLCLVTGEDFFNHFKKFGGKGKNSKIQMSITSIFNI